MKTLRSLSLVLAVCLSASWLAAQSNAIIRGSQPNAITAQSLAIQPRAGTSLAPVQAIVTDGETGEVIADSTLTFTTIDVPGAGFTSVQRVNTSGEMAGIYAETSLSPPMASA
jgi:hypothetical protein